MADAKNEYILECLSTLEALRGDLPALVSKVNPDNLGFDKSNGDFYSKEEILDEIDKNLNWLRDPDVNLSREDMESLNSNVHDIIKAIEENDYTITFSDSSSEAMNDHIIGGIRNKFIELYEEFLDEEEEENAAEIYMPPLQNSQEGQNGDVKAEIEYGEIAYDASAANPSKGKGGLIGWLVAGVAVVGTSIAAVIGLANHNNSRQSQALNNPTPVAANDLQNAGNGATTPLPTQVPLNSTEANAALKEAVKIIEDNESLLNKGGAALIDQSQKLGKDEVLQWYQYYNREQYDALTANGQDVIKAARAEMLKVGQDSLEMHTRAAKALQKAGMTNVDISSDSRSGTYFKTVDEMIARKPNSSAANALKEEFSAPKKAEALISPNANDQRLSFGQGNDNISASNDYSVVSDTNNPVFAVKPSSIKAPAVTQSPFQQLKDHAGDHVQAAFKSVQKLTDTVGAVFQNPAVQLSMKGVAVGGALVGAAVMARQAHEDLKQGNNYLAGMNASGAVAALATASAVMGATIASPVAVVAGAARVGFYTTDRMQFSTQERLATQIEAIEQRRVDLLFNARRNGWENMELSVSGIQTGIKKADLMIATSLHYASTKTPLAALNDAVKTTGAVMSSPKMQAIQQKASDFTAAKLSECQKVAKDAQQVTQSAISSFMGMFQGRQAAMAG